MIQHNLKVGQKVVFANEQKLPYTILAGSERYVIASRKLSRRGDAEMLHAEVRMSAYCSFTEAYNDLKDSPIYTIMDFKEMIRGAHNMIFNCYDFSNERSMKKLIIDLERGKVEISHRNRAPLNIEKV